MRSDRAARALAARPWPWLCALVVLTGGQGASGEVALGRALFYGGRPLVAHIAGQAWELPPSAVACSNCHQPAPSPGPGADLPGGGPLSFGPPLTRAALTEAHGRRGGPPSAYDRNKLCRAMREGIDPALVIIPQTMPRYLLTEEQCGAIWAFLLARS
jgi:hypothetical protein